MKCDIDPFVSPWEAYRVTKDPIGQESNKKVIDSPKWVFYNPTQFVEKWRKNTGIVVDNTDIVSCSVRLDAWLRRDD